VVRQKNTSSVKKSDWTVVPQKNGNASPSLRLYASCRKIRLQFHTTGHGSLRGRPASSCWRAGWRRASARYGSRHGGGAATRRFIATAAELFHGGDRSNVAHSAASPPSAADQGGQPTAMYFVKAESQSNSALPTAVIQYSFTMQG
jgi:hypothetical protein